MTVYVDNKSMSGFFHAMDVESGWEILTWSAHGMGEHYFTMRFTNCEQAFRFGFRFGLYYDCPF